MPNGLSFPRVPNHAAIAAIERRGGNFTPSGYWYEVWEQAHQTAFTVAQSAGFDILKDIYDALHTAMSDGVPFAQFRRELTPILQKKGWWGKSEDGRQLGAPWRFKTIYNQNLRVSAAQGDWERFQAMKESRPWLRYTALLDGRTRPLHASWHGLILPVDHPWWDTHFPPNGWNCRCKALSVGPETLKLYGWQVSENAPDDGMRIWENPATGEKIEVPNGIDPGWAYNPGSTDNAARLAKLEMDKLLLMPAQEVDYALAAIAPSFPQVQKELGGWIASIAAKIALNQFHSTSERRVVGALKKEVRDFIKDKFATEQPASITLGDESILHLLRSSKQNRLPPDKLEKIPELLYKVEAIYWDKRENGLVYICDKGTIKILIQPDYRKKLNKTLNNNKTRLSIHTNNLRDYLKIKDRNIIEQASWIIEK